MERPGVPGHLWVLLLMPIALWLTPPVSVTANSSSKPTVVATSLTGLTSTKSVSPTTTVTKLSSSLSSTVTTTMTSTKTTPTSTTTPTTPTIPTTTTTTLPTTAAPVSPGEDCDKETPSPPCVSNAFCNDTKMCQCNSTHYEDDANTCRERHNYTQSCTENKQCFETNNETCVNNSGSTGGKCLCSHIAFRRTDLKQCKMDAELKVTGLGKNTTADYMETSIAVQWNAPSDVPTGVQYQATLNESNTPHWGTDTQHTFTEFEPGTSLVPGTTYTVTVTTRVPRNPEHVDSGNATATTGPVTVYTKPAVPGNLTASQYAGPNVKLQFNSSGGHVDKYKVTLQPGNTKGDINNPASGNVQSVTLSGLTPGTFYNVTIVAVITGPNPDVESDPFNGKFRVKANSSGQVDGLSVRDTGSRWVEASWQKPLSPNGNMTGYVVVALFLSAHQCASAITFRCTDCMNNSTTSEQNDTLTDLSCGPSSIQTTTSADLNSLTKEFRGNLTGLLPDLPYKVRVYPYNEAGEGTVDERNASTKEEAPTLTPPTGRKLVEQKGITQREVALDVCPCLVSKEQGTITLAGIIVCVTTNDDDCKAGVGDASMYKDRQKLPTWKDFKDKGYKGKYRATPDNWHTIIGEGGTRRRRRSLLKRVARDADDFVKYTLGANSSCEQAKPDVYCNGPLPAGQKIKIFVFACTRAGCSEVIALEDLRTEAFADEDNTDAIVGGIAAALAVIALVVVAVFMYRRYRPIDGDGGHSPLKPHAPRVIRKPIKLKDFTAHLDRLQKDSNLLFQEEFEDVQENSPKQYSQEAATLDVNKVKNRYVNILPYDHTRVKLITDDDDDSSDFINANYIPGYTSPREYIATQGPMTGTIADFWRMMWEQKSSLVVMLSDLQEKGRPKVDMYWPGEMNSPVQYGNIVVELTSDSTLNKYTIRTFKLYVENNPDDSRRVTQYFIPGWEDYSANLSPDDVLDFIGSVRQSARSGQGQGPVCVHCSAGVGRTGTFIALDFLVQFVSEHSLDDEVDIYNLVLNMRHKRPYMVQSEKQYVFIHDTLKLIIDRKIKEMQAQDEHVYGNTQPEDNIYANQAFEPDENLYENTTSMSVKLTTSL